MHTKVLLGMTPDNVKNTSVMIDNCHNLCHKNNNNLADFGSIIVRATSERFNRESDAVEVFLEWVLIPDSSLHTYHVNVTVQYILHMCAIVLRC